jgi:uncharacterized repeat protein (TIGR01451 family)
LNTKRPPVRTYFYDGGVLDIAIGSGSFNDIISAGGSFVTGGYNGTFTPARAIRWRAAALGAAIPAAGLRPPSTFRLRRRAKMFSCAGNARPMTGNDSTVVGWYVDTISLKDGYYSCCGDSASLSVTQTAIPSQFVVGQNGTYTIAVTNAGPDLAADVVVTGTLPSTVTFVSASPGSVFSNGVIVCPVGTLLSGSSSNMTITVLADAIRCHHEYRRGQFHHPRFQFRQQHRHQRHDGEHFAAGEHSPIIILGSLSVTVGNGLSVCQQRDGIELFLGLQEFPDRSGLDDIARHHRARHRRCHHLARHQPAAGATILRRDRQLTVQGPPLERPRADDPRPNQKGRDPQRQRRQRDPLQIWIRGQKYETPPASATKAGSG